MGSPARRRCLDMVASAVLAVSLISPPASAQTNCTDHTFAGGRAYAACSALEELGASVHWTHHAAKGTADVAFRVPGGTAGWATWAINPSAVGMLGANTVFATDKIRNITFAYHDTATGGVRVLAAVVDSYAPVVADGNLTFPVHSRGAEYVDGVYDVHATISLPGNSTRQNIVWQVGTSSSSDGLPESHQAYGDNVMSSRSWDFSSGEAAVVEDVPAPRDSVYSTLPRRKNIHGVLNAVSWGVLLPLGVILARYMRVFPSLDPAWFYLHVACQCSGYVIGVAGWIVGLTHLGNPAKGALQQTGHRNIRTALFVLSTLQASALLIRPKKTVKVRFYWNLYHWSVGYTVVIMGIFNVFDGIGILQPHHKYKHAYIGVVLVLAVVAFVLEVVTLTVRFKKGRP